MASLMENLIDVLGRESTEYEALLQLSQRKTPIIAGGDLAELQKITDEEQELVSRIHNLDRQRAGVTADIADVLNRDVKELKLPNLMTPCYLHALRSSRHWQKHMTDYRQQSGTEARERTEQ